MKVKLSRRVGVPIADNPKHTKEELTLPGMHGYRGRRNTEYGVRLTEKQKLRFHYSMQEKQFRRFLQDYAAQSMRMMGAWRGLTKNVLESAAENAADNIDRMQHQASDAMHQAGEQIGQMAQDSSNHVQETQH